MSLREDRRGQAVQVGAVLLFAVLIVAFSTYQAVIVPADNRRVEFNHNQEVQTHLAELRSAIIGTAESTGVRSVTVPLGTRYPSRALGLNPTSPGGSLRTVGTTNPMVNLTIDNAAASGETGDFWNGSARVYNTGAIRYSPIYNGYDEAPETVYEHSMLYNRFPSANVLVLGNQTLVEDGRLSVVTIDGSIDRTSSRSTAVDVRPASSSGRTVWVSADSAPIFLNFSSQLPRDRWDAIVPDRHTVSDGSFPSPEGFHSISVELAQRDDGYRLGMAKAAVGQGATGEDAAYLTDVGGLSWSVDRGSDRQLRLSVRDRYNNPVSGIPVAGNVAGSSAGELEHSTVTTDADGEATFTYETNAGTETDTHAVNFTIGDAAFGDSFDPETPENVTMAVTVSGGGGNDGSDGVYGVEWTDPDGESENGDAVLSNCDDRTCTWNVGASNDDTLALNATLSPPFDGVGLEFAVSDSTVGTVSPGGATTGIDGAATTTLFPNANGTVDVLASGNEGSDTIEIVIENAGAGGGSSGQVVAYPDEFDDIDYNYPDPESGENNSIPPSGDGRGELTNGFANMQNPDDGDATSGVHSRNGQLAIGTATRNISERGSEYTLEIRHNHPTYRSAVTVEIVDPSTGQTIQSRPLAYTSNDGFVTESISLNTQAEQSVTDGGALYVVYTGAGNAYADVDYQRVEVD